MDIRATCVAIELSWLLHKVTYDHNVRTSLTSAFYRPVSEVQTGVLRHRYIPCIICKAGRGQSICKKSNNAIVATPEDVSGKYKEPI